MLGRCFAVALLPLLAGCANSAVPAANPAAATPPVTSAQVTAGLAPGGPCDGGTSFRLGDEVLTDGVHERPFGTVTDLPADGPIRVSMRLGGDTATMGSWTADLWDGKDRRTARVGGSIDEDGRSGTAVVPRSWEDGTGLTEGRYVLEIYWQPKGCADGLREDTSFSVRLR